MTLFRARQWGQGDWTEIFLNNKAEDDETELAVSGIIGSALETSSLHVQRMGDDGEWEDLS